MRNAYRSHGVSRAVVRVLAVAGAAGSVLLTAGPAGAMAGGTPVLDDGTAPWAATLAQAGDAPLLQRAGCGGVLVASDRVLTAAHCVLGADPSTTEVHLNARVLSQQPGVVRGVRGIATVPGFALLPSPIDPTDVSLSSAKNDLAVVLLDRPVTTIAPLRLAERRLPASAAVSVFAHGTSGTAGAEWRNDVLHRGDLTVLTAPECGAATPAVVDGTSIVCARAVGTGGCYLDSGSPFVGYGASAPVLVGVFSFAGETAGKACTEPSPEYYTDVTAFLGWIRQPSPLRQPYPAGPTRITGEVTGGVTTVGATLRCVAPAWDTTRGGRPASIGYGWATMTRYGSLLVPTPIDGETGSTLKVAGSLAGTEVACGVSAANAGGTTQTVSAPVAVQATAADAA